MLLAVAPAAKAAPPKARTQSGIGILLLSKDQPQLILYKEPSLGRIATKDASALPLSPSIRPPAGYLAAVVTAKKRDWYRIIYDDTEREGWIKGVSSYRYHRWGELLVGRPIWLLGGLKKEYYQLRHYPDFAAAPLETVGKGAEITVLHNEDDWFEAVTETKTHGWLRWRDDNSRLVISIQL
jgi:hypothetical protein